MSAAKPPRWKRRSYIVDRFQLAITGQLLAVSAGLGLLYFLALAILPGEEAMASMEAIEARNAMLRANLIYFVLGAAVMGMVALVLTHRLAGPARVLRVAIAGMRHGDFDRRLRLRKRDYLQDLAVELERFRNGLIESQREREHLLAELDRCLRENRADAARELVDRMKAHRTAGASGADEASTADVASPAVHA